MMPPVLVATAAALAVAFAAPALAVVDPAGDFLDTHTGPGNADIDIRRADAFRTPLGFAFDAVMAGPIGGTPGATYVWGIDRGAGVAGLFNGFPPVGPGVTFDAVIVIGGDGTASVTAFNEAGPPTVTPVTFGPVIAANGIGVFVAGFLVPSRGFAPKDYRFNLWTRSGGGNAGIADLAQEEGTFGAVPEPATWGLLIAGFGLVGHAARRRRSQPGLVE